MLFLSTQKIPCDNDNNKLNDAISLELEIRELNRINNTTWMNRIKSREQTYERNQRTSECNANHALAPESVAVTAQQKINILIFFKRFLFIFAMTSRCAACTFIVNVLQFIIYELLLFYIIHNCLVIWVSEWLLYLQWNDSNVFYKIWHRFLFSGTMPDDSQFFFFSTFSSALSIRFSCVGRNGIWNVKKAINFANDEVL